MSFQVAITTAGPLVISRAGADCRLWLPRRRDAAASVAQTLTAACEARPDADVLQHAAWCLPSDVPILSAAPGLPRGALPLALAGSGSESYCTTAGDASPQIACSVAIEDAACAKADGNHCFGAGQYDKAFRLYRQGLRALEPALTHVSRTAADSASQCAADVTAAAMVLLVNAAVAAFKMTQQPEAERTKWLARCSRACERALGMRPHHPKALLFAAKAALADGDYDKAATFANRLVEASQCDSSGATATEVNQLAQAAAEARELLTEARTRSDLARERNRRAQRKAFE
jgi:hypothetical protein